MASEASVTRDDTKIGSPIAWVNKAALQDFLDSLAIAVGEEEGDIGVIEVQEALDAITTSINKNVTPINVLDEQGQTTLLNMPSEIWVDNTQASIEELQTRYTDLVAALKVAGVTV